VKTPAKAEQGKKVGEWVLAHICIDSFRSSKKMTYWV